MLTTTSAETSKCIEKDRVFCIASFLVSLNLTEWAFFCLSCSYDSTLEEIADGASDTCKDICGDDAACLIDCETLGEDAGRGAKEDELDEGEDDGDFDDDDGSDDEDSAVSENPPIVGPDALPPSEDDEKEDPEDTKNKDRSEAANIVDELADGTADCVVPAGHPDASDKDATYWEVAENMKCPFKNDQGRLFRIEGIKNVKKCYKECKDTEGCVNFSVGMHKGDRICMGCTAQGLTGLKKHDGFTAYELTPKGAEKKKISKNCPDKKGKKDKQKKVDDAVEKAKKNKNKDGRCKATGWGDPQ